MSNAPLIGMTFTCDQKDYENEQFRTSFEAHAKSIFCAHRGTHAKDWFWIHTPAHVWTDPDDGKRYDVPAQATLTVESSGATLSG